MRLLLGYLAGTLSTLSPCVLPALPLVLGSARQTHRLGPLVMAAGLVASSTLVGFSLASLGPLLGIDAKMIRNGASILLIVAGFVLLVDRAAIALSAAFSPLAARASAMGESNRLNGLFGQFLLGGVLGAVWSPCAGPTLGAAIALAAQEGERLWAFMVMLSFGFGAATPLLILGELARGVLARQRGSLLRVSRALKASLGAFLVVLGGALLTGLESSLEADLLDLLPQIWIDFVARV